MSEEGSSANMLPGTHYYLDYCKPSVGGDTVSTCPCTVVKVSQVNGAIVAHAECSRDDCVQWQQMVAERDALRADNERLRTVMEAERNALRAELEEFRKALLALCR